MKLRFKATAIKWVENHLRADRSPRWGDPNETNVLWKAWVKKAFHEMPYRRSSAFVLTLTVKCLAHRAIPLVYRIFFMEYLKKKKNREEKNSKTFQGNKSPCDSDCLFNNIKPKKGQRKILLENCPMIVYLLKMIRFDHQQVEIWAIRCLRRLHQLQETGLQW